MNTKLLVDNILRQTTVFVAQLCTAAGVRAPLAHIADEVFLGLARQLEEQGVSRKVAADMFGLALRGYQKKVQRLTESVTQRDKTLWEAVVEFLRDEGSATRARIFERFRGEPEGAVAAILADLVGNGLVYCTGRGVTVLYGLTSSDDLNRLARGELRDSVPEMVALLACREGPISEAELSARLCVDAEVVQSALVALQAEGRLRVDEETGEVSSAVLHIPVGAEKGWEAAVLDHFQSVVRALLTKLRQGPVSRAADVVGGQTLSFDLRRGHPLEGEVLGLLAEVRGRASELWQRTVDSNADDPIAEEEKVVVTFYCGQSVKEPD